MGGKSPTPGATGSLDAVAMRATGVLSVSLVPEHRARVLSSRPLPLGKLSHHDDNMEFERHHHGPRGPAGSSRDGAGGAHVDSRADRADPAAAMGERIRTGTGVPGCAAVLGCGRPNLVVGCRASGPTGPVRLTNSTWSARAPLRISSALPRPIASHGPYRNRPHHVQYCQEYSVLIRHTPVFIVASSIVIVIAAVAGLPPAFLLPLPLVVALPILAVLLHDTGIVGR